MTLIHTIRPDQNIFLGSLKSFFIWSFVLTVCWLVLGFPLVALIVTVGTLLAIALQTVVSGSAIFFVAMTLLASNIMMILLSAAILTLRGIYPHEIKWLAWLRASESKNRQPLFASCPLTCDRYVKAH
jgi:hypothetical protein